MRDWPTSAANWVRRLLRFKTGQASDDTNNEHRTIATGGLAVLMAESLICDGLYRQGRSDGVNRSSKRAVEGLALNAFNRPVAEVLRDGPRAILASSAGLAMTGKRSAAFVAGDRLAEMHDQLFAAAGRRIPMVIHGANRAMPRQSRAFGTGHEGYHAVSDTGAFLVQARNAQHAVDLTLVARRLAELCLGPGVLAIDSAEIATAPQDLVFPDAELVKQYLGAPEALIDCPTQSQRMLFGSQRRTVPAWFDLDHPTGHGALQAGSDYAVATAGQELFFFDHVRELAEKAMADLTALTGRTLSFVHRHGLEKARCAIVTHGSTVELAQNVVDRIKATEKTQIGVLAIDWLRPFPGQEVDAALRGLDAVVVLERCGDPLASSAPLTGELRSVIGNNGPRISTCLYGIGGQSVTGGQLMSLCRKLVEGTLPQRAFLGMSAATSSAYPKREVLLSGVQRAYPKLGESLLGAGEMVDLRPEGAKTVSVFSSPSTIPEEGLTVLAQELSSAIGPHVRSRSQMVAHRVWSGSVTASETALIDLGDDVAADAVVITSLDIPAYLNPLSSCSAGASVIFSLPLTGQELWERLPSPWRARISEQGLNVYLAPFEWTVLGVAVARVCAGDETEIEAIDWKSMDAPATATVEPELPHVIKRVDRNDTAYDNPARFWGDTIQPRMMGEAPLASPDPYLSLGAVPASTATFRDATSSRAELPQVDVAACTGCGDCWAACPDSALGPVAVGINDLLDAAADQAGVGGPVAGKLKRSHKHLAGRIQKLLTDSGTKELTEDVIRDAFGWLREKLGVTPDEDAELNEVFDATLKAALRIPISVTDKLFHQREKSQKGSGALFMLALNSKTCQGCAACVEACQDDAIKMVPQTAQAIALARATWNAFEETPDTSGELIAALGEGSEMGPLAAALLSRHCQQALAGGSASEPGSGARLGTRLVAGAVEKQTQQRVLHQADKLTELAQQLREKIKSVVTDGLPVDDLGSLDQALSAIGKQSADVDAISTALKSLGQTRKVDTGYVKSMANLAQTLEGLNRDLVEGVGGVGRSRFGVVVASGGVEEWAARFPHNPFFGPVAVDLGGDGPEIAAGVAEGLLAEMTGTARLIRRAELLLDAPSDLAAQDAELNKLTWRDLNAEELTNAVPLILLADAESLGDRALSGLSELLGTDWPVRVVLLDRRESVGRGADPTLLGLCHRRAFVLASTIAHTDHLFAGLVEALEYPGPALIHLYAPSPQNDGFGRSGAIRRAKLAVDCRVHPLLRYDPRGEGVFGTRIDLAGNPEPTVVWAKGADGVELYPTHWALTLRRWTEDLRLLEDETQTQSIADYLANPSDTAVSQKSQDGERSHELNGALIQVTEDRLANWTTLQELAGIVTPFTARVREEAAAQVGDTHASELAALKAEYEAKLAESRAEERAAQAARLRDRLVQLANVRAVGSLNEGGQNT